MSANEIAAPQPEPGKPRRRWKRWTAIAGIAAVVLIVGLALPTWVGGWAPLAHWTCQPGSQVLNQSAQIPAQLLNAPFGGRVWANVTTPPGLILRGTSIETGLGTSDSNGGVDWNGFQANVTVSTVENETAWGPGSNVRCTQPFEVNLIANGDVSTGIAILGPGNISDQHEPNVLFPGYANTIYFSNGFQAANSENISTCGGPAQSLPLVTSNYLTLWAHFASGGQNYTIPFTLHLVESQFHYWFPANFGMWQVDNLSAPGGPGGGWAFSYSPCP